MGSWGFGLASLKKATDEFLNGPIRGTPTATMSPSDTALSEPPFRSAHPRATPQARLA